MPAHETISEQTRPAPYRRPWRRNACTLTPAIGARTTRVGISTPAIHHDSCKFTRIEREMVPGRLLTSIPGWRYHPPPPDGWSSRAGRFHSGAPGGPQLEGG